jgi:hypothetical protein
MVIFRHHLRLPWLVLAAIMGMLSMAVEVSAGSTKGATDAPRSKSCCVVPPPSDCRCCPAKARSFVPAIERSAASTTVEARLFSAALPCECRSDLPTDPASRPESREAEPRPERIGETAVDPSFVAVPLARFTRFVPPTGSPPGSPLSLLTTRLLI